MTIRLVREGNRYRPDPAVDVSVLPDVLIAEIEGGRLPTYFIGGAEIDGALGPLLMKMVAEEKRNEEKQGTVSVRHAASKRKQRAPHSGGVARKECAT